MSIQEDTTLKKAYTKLEEISDDQYLQRIEELKMKKILDDNSVRNHLIEEGRQEGAKKEKKEIAKKLLLEGMKLEKVSEITELSIDEIKKL